MFSIPDGKKPGKLIAFHIRPGRKTKVKGSLDDDTPVIDVKLNLEADIGGIESRFDYESLENIENLNKQLEKHLKEGIQKTIAKTQNELKADVFEFGTKIAGHFSTIQSFEAYNWLAHYPEAKINVEVNVNVRRTGLMIKSSPICTPDGKE